MRSFISLNAVNKHFFGYNCLTKNATGNSRRVLIILQSKKPIYFFIAFSFYSEFISSFILTYLRSVFLSLRKIP